MLSRTDARWQLGVIVIGVLLLSVDSACGWLLPHHDLDSLIYLSTDVIEGTLNSIDSVTVTHVYKGKFSVGQTVRVWGMDHYPKGHLVDSGKLGAGDTVTLFIISVTEAFPEDVPEGMESYRLVSSGIKLHVDGKVLGFRQFDNPGGYVLRAHEDAVAAAPMSEAYRDQIIEQVPYVDRVAPELAKPSAEQSVEWLYELIDERCKRQLGHDDEMSRIACAHLAMRRDPEEIDGAVRIYCDNAATMHYKPWRYTEVLVQGLATPAGRQHLLTQLGDPDVDDEVKLVYARAADRVGHVYQSINYLEYLGEERGVSPEAGPNNDWYLTRLAELIASPSTLPEVRTHLLRALRYPRPESEGEEVSKDFTKAAAVLTELHATTSDSQLKYEIEESLAGVGVSPVDMSAYEALNSQSGPSLSRMLEATVVLDEETGVSTLQFSSKICILVVDAWDDVTLIVENVETGAKVSLPLPEGSKARTLELAGRKCQSGSGGVVPIPADLPPGRYLVYLVFLKDGQVVSTGYGMEIDWGVVPDESPAGQVEQDRSRRPTFYILGGATLLVAIVAILCAVGRRSENTP